VSSFEERLKTLTADDDLGSMPVAAWDQAVREAVDHAGADDVCDMARAAHRLPAPAWEQGFQRRLAEASGLVPVRARQLAVLAGAALAAAFDDAGRGPLAMLCSVGAAHAGLTPELPDAAVGPQRLRAAETAERRPPAARPPKVTVPPAGWEAALPAPGSAVTADHLRAVASALTEAVTNAMARGHQAMTRAATKREAGLHEQVGVLNWLLTGHSTVAGLPWADLAPAEAAVAAVVELDGLTRFPLGVPVADRLLAQTVALSGGPDRADPGRTAALLDRLPDPGRIADLAPVLSSAREGSVGRADPAGFAADLYAELRLVAAYGAT